MIYISKPNIIRFLKCDTEEISEQTISYLESLINKDFLEIDKQNEIKQRIRECFYSDGSKIIIINITIYALLRIFQNQMLEMILKIDKDIKIFLDITEPISQEDKNIINQIFYGFILISNTTYNTYINSMEIMRMNNIQAVKYIEKNIKSHNQNMEKAYKEYEKIQDFKKNIQTKYPQINIL